MLGGFLFGLYLYICSRWLGKHMPIASSALRLNGYRNFLRLRLSKNQMTIYPIGLDNVPNRNEWVKNKQPDKGAPVSVYKSKSNLEPFLIEPPITITHGPETSEDLA